MRRKRNNQIPSTRKYSKDFSSSYQTQYNGTVMKPFTGYLLLKIKGSLGRGRIRVPLFAQYLESAFADRGFIVNK